VLIYVTVLVVLCIAVGDLVIKRRGLVSHGDLVIKRRGMVYHGDLVIKRRGMVSHGDLVIKRRRDTIPLILITRSP
jgi:hypothetical protein